MRHDIDPDAPRSAPSFGAWARRALPTTAREPENMRISLLLLPLALLGLAGCVDVDRAPPQHETTVVTPAPAAPAVVAPPGTTIVAPHD